MKGINERAIDYLADNIDSDDIQEGISQFIDQKVFPELDEVRQRAAGDNPPAVVREELEGMPQDRREELFHGVLGDIIATLFEIRVRPATGLQQAKAMLRDPYVVESVLLIFDHPEVDSEERAAMKDFAAKHIQALGVAIAPEMYEREEVMDVAEEFGIDTDLVEYYDDQYGDVEDVDPEAAVEAVED